ncbi:alpha/beta hydrolase [bacterium]|nr:alpha/beta hydrolase [bacterium]
MKTIYCLSGLGADERVFGRLRVPGYALATVQWTSFERVNTLSDYARKLRCQIPQDSRPILLGVSFGGVMALELSRLVHSELTVLISSVKSPSQLPWYFRCAGRMRLNRIIPANLSRSSAFLARWFNGVSAPDEVLLFNRIFADTDFEFTSWAADRLLRWPGCEPVGQVIHIHGDADRMLPVRYVNPDVVVRGGTHFMVVSRGDDVSRAVARFV